MQSFVHVVDLVRADRCRNKWSPKASEQQLVERYLMRHVKYFMRAMRLNAYRQRLLNQYF